MITEAEIRATEIMNTYGIDGIKHIDQLIYFADGCESKELYVYWAEVKANFLLIKKKNTWTQNKEKKDPYLRE